MKIVTNNSFGLIDFGMSEIQVVNLIGEPIRKDLNDDGVVEYFYDDFIVRFDADEKLVKEGTLLPKRAGELQINDIILDWRDDFFKTLCEADGDPYESYGFIILFNLGIALTGFHDEGYGQNFITVFKEGSWGGPEDDDITPFNLGQYALDEAKAYFYIKAEVVGGAKAGFTDHKEVKPRYVFDGWKGDELIELSSSFIITEPLAVMIEKNDFSGFLLKDIDVEKSISFIERNRDIALPVFRLLKINGAPGRDDFGLVNEMGKEYLVVSRRALYALRKGVMDNAVWDIFYSDGNVNP